jgi:hypothetical protein
MPKGHITQVDKELLNEFLTWLDHHTDTMDPVMIQMARDHGQRHLAPDHVQDLVNLFVAMNPHEFRGEGGNAWAPCTVCQEPLQDTAGMHITIDRTPPTLIVNGQRTLMD